MSKKKRMCKLCGVNEATVPDRDFQNIGRRLNEVCSECHGARLRGDMYHILSVTRKRREEAAKIGLNNTPAK